MSAIVPKSQTRVETKETNITDDKKKGSAKLTTQDECPETDEHTAATVEQEPAQRDSEVSPGEAACFDRTGRTTMTIRTETKETNITDDNKKGSAKLATKDECPKSDEHTAAPVEEEPTQSDSEFYLGKAACIDRTTSQKLLKVDRACHWGPGPKIYDDRDNAIFEVSVANPIHGSQPRTHRWDGAESTDFCALGILT
jgi:hypothetical protein